MTASPTIKPGFSTIDGYQLRLPMFEGPLDVLLRLIERNQLEITDVSLVEVTDQFLAYAAEMPEANPSVLADFAAIASRLLVLKSRSLLPSIESDDDEPETDDLAQQLIEYKAVRDAAAALEDRQKQGLHAFRRPPVAGEWGETSESLLPMTADALVRALKRCVQRQTREPDSFRPRPVISLADMARSIVGALRKRGRARFRSLLSDEPDRHEYVAGFVALLNLWKQRTVEVWQAQNFAEIEVAPTANEQVADD